MPTKKNQKKSTPKKPYKASEHVGVAALGRVKSFGLWKSLITIAAVVAVGAGILYFSEAAGLPDCRVRTDRGLPRECTQQGLAQRNRDAQKYDTKAKAEMAETKKRLDIVHVRLTSAVKYAAKSQREITKADYQAAEANAREANKYVGNTLAHYKAERVYWDKVQWLARVAQRVEVYLPNLSSAEVVAHKEAIRGYTIASRGYLDAARKDAAAANVFAKEAKRKYNDRNSHHSFVYSGGSVQQLIVYWAGVYGVDQNRALNIARCESTFNPQASNGSHFGVYQFDSITWREKYPQAGAGSDVWDASNNVKTAMFVMGVQGEYRRWQCKGR